MAPQWGLQKRKYLNTLRSFEHRFKIFVRARAIGLTFLFRTLPLFNGPRVKLRLVPSGSEYEVALDLIREKSLYFANMFQDCFIEGAEGEATLEEIDGVVSPRSIEGLLEWMYREKIILKSTDLQDQLSEGLELLRMADMCDVYGMEQVFTDHMQNFLRNVDLKERLKAILPQHIESVSLLPRSHPFRPVMAKVLALSVIENKKLSLSVSKYPSICADILGELRTIFHSASVTSTRGKRMQNVFVTYRDPISCGSIRIHNREFEQCPSVSW